MSVDRTLPTKGMSAIDAFTFSDLRPMGYFESDGILLDSTERHTVEIVGTPVYSASGQAYVGLDVRVAPTGSLGTWGAAAFFRFAEGTTHAINGYSCAAEFEWYMGAAADTVVPRNHAVLVLNYWNAASTNLNNCQHYAYIQFHDYGANKCDYLFDLPDATDVAGGIFEAVAQADSDHGLKIKVGTTDYWIMLSDTA